MGVGSLLIFLTKPGLIALSSLRGKGGRRRGGGGFIKSQSSIYALSIAADPAEKSMCVFVCVHGWESRWGWGLTRITGCRSPVHCGSPCLQSSSLSQPGNRGQEEDDVRGADGHDGLPKSSPTFLHHFSALDLQKATRI